MFSLTLNVSLCVITCVIFNFRLSAVFGVSVLLLSSAVMSFLYYCWSTLRVQPAA